MRIAAVIPARGGSKRIPGKNILSLRGKPLIAHSIEQARKSQLVNRVIVSTDDAEISQVSKQYGAEVIQRSRDLSTDTATSESALLHVLEYLETQENYLPDLLVFLQCTSPMRKDDDIDNAIRIMIEEKADTLFSAFRFNKYIWTMKNGVVNPINYDYQNRWREQDFPVQYQENGSIYVVKPAILKENNNRLGGKIAVYEMDYLNSFQLDSYEDIKLFEFLMTNK
ncbi:MAG: acylneuraminate cytidylyltransferase family protein [Candidatus Schekmanbacteria bacterium]|nr:acylneuraminate cytidylyltransferase family protein [Candidatus Schekmanbacteria bacterium]